MKHDIYEATLCVQMTVYVDARSEVEAMNIIKNEIRKMDYKEFSEGTVNCLELRPVDISDECMLEDSDTDYVLSSVGHLDLDMYCIDAIDNDDEEEDDDDNDYRSIIDSRGCRVY